MKAKIILALLIVSFVQLSSYGQYDIYDLQLQMNMQIYQQRINKVLNSIDKEHSYYCMNGRNLACSFTISRISGGLINPIAIIQNEERIKTKQLDICTNLGTHVSVVNVGKESWELAFGDRITISTDGDVSVSFNIGIDDNMSEIDWNAYKDQLINESKQQIQRNTVDNSTNQQINKGMVVYPIVSPNNNSGRSSLRLVRETCSSCGGTGVSRSWTSVPTYGNTDQSYCEVCKCMVSASHGAHLNCVVCGGKGYVEHYR